MGKKTIGTFLFLGFLLFVMTITMPVTRLGSGFLVGEGQHVLTYHDLVKEAGVLKVKFPNEDDIAAEVVFTDPASNLAILKLKEMPKVKRLPLSISTKSLSLQGEQVFTLGYPWTNTLEDQHVLIEGSARPASMLIELKMPLNLVHSGSPLFNARQEVVGLVLLEEHAKATFPVKTSQHFAIPALLLEKALKAARVNKTPLESFSRKTFIAESRNNIVLIEAR
ncbi:MAG: S1 family peptidase [Nitrospinaceae bacterium]|jgi:S1-C subfamily serine protease|tara:strand:+ start:1151 stop:1819 length:669 start_codon:yes stop_codon:yes gene_type:complete